MRRGTDEYIVKVLRWAASDLEIDYDDDECVGLNIRALRQLANEIEVGHRPFSPDAIPKLIDFSVGPVASKNTKSQEGT